MNFLGYGCLLRITLLFIAVVSVHKFERTEKK